MMNGLRRVSLVYLREWIPRFQDINGRVQQSLEDNRTTVSPWNAETKLRVATGLGHLPIWVRETGHPVQSGVATKVGTDTELTHTALGTKLLTSRQRAATGFRSRCLTLE